MKIKDKDFIWLCDTRDGTIDWGYVMDGRVILQNGGFEDLSDFNEFGAYDTYESYFIGGVVRNASSFISARTFYEHSLTDNARFLDHNTKMVAFSASEWAEKCYEHLMGRVRKMDVDRLSDIFGQKIEIV